ncbi:MAG: GAF domain-containing protein, partial [Coriobacteriales bacterium]|nr:GAF domain-containing protein [Coriobacteriales bacterium]
MAHRSSSSFHRGTFAVLIICLALPLLASWYIVQYLNRDIFYEQKGSNLTAIARMLDTQLSAGGYDEILREAGAEQDSREEKIAVLNAALEDATDKVASVSEGLGVGFYSRELDAILTYGPSAEFADNVGRPIGEDHPGRIVMATDTPRVEQGSMVRGNIMNAMIPVDRNGEVIGYIWANELISDLEEALNRSALIITLLLSLAYLIMVAIVVIFFRRLLRIEGEARASVEAAMQETQRLDTLMHIVNRAVSSLLSADESSFKTALENCMEMMASAFEVDRLIIWKQKDLQGKQAAFYPEAVYSNEVGSSYGSIDFAESLPAVSAWDQWLDELKANRSVTRLVGAEGEEGSAWLTSFGIKAMTTIPVFLQEEFWGFVNFSNCKKERSFTQDEEGILFSGSLLMANAIARNEMLQQLMDAREEALAGTQAKSAFLASMSHEMRTPLNAIIGMTSIGKGSDDLEQKDYCLAKIDEASEHLLGVINDILDISKIEADKFELSEEEFNFEHMLEAVAGIIGFRVDKKQQEFLVRVDENIPRFLYGDDQRIAQVITNLLGNSVKFTPEKGTIELDASLVSQKADTCIVEIRVKDNGIGIASDKQAQLFQSFTQEDNSTVRKYGGTGLGLAISKRIVEMMGGHIWVESEKDLGSVFGFTVKLQLGAQGRGEGSESSGYDTALWDQLRVLVVDDNIRELESFRSIGTQLGLKAHYLALGGEDIGEIIRRDGPFDLSFVEGNRTGRDALDVVRRIRAVDSEQRVVLMVSAAELSRVQGEAREAGVDAFLEKPLFASRVAECLNRYIGIEQTREPFQEDTTDCFKGHRILLAEDVEINREIVLALLEYTGLDIEWAETGTQAVEMFKADLERYEMIFM